MPVTLVERTEELEKLDHFLSKALAGRGQLCFVRGEGGAGKTTLLAAFTEQALNAHEDLVVATGTCDAQTGIGDAFLPFREILELLTGNVDSKLAQGRITDENAGRLRKMFSMCTEAIVELGPDLIGAVVPGATFVAALGMYVASKTPWAEKLQTRLEKVGKVGGENIDQNQIFEQYLKVLEALSQKTPLVLVIDDLQWADTASVSLLFRLGRRIEQSRILVIGLYRPSDVALGRAGERHPLEPLINEMKRYHGEVEIDLDRSAANGRNFVNSFLDLENNLLSEGFRRALYQKTGGHALFTVELLRALQERGDLVRDVNGRWVEGPHLDWTDLPSRVEGVIEERLDRLDDELRRSLTIAAVEGENFTAEVVSHVQPAEMRKLVAQLSDTLQKRHQLVAALGVERLGNQRLSRYRFSHNLMQSYLLDNLDEVESSFLHEDVGKALEDLHQIEPEAIAVQLARHFDLAGVAQKAQRYLALAGDRAMEVFANHEALAHYTRALEWATEDADRFRLVLARLKVHELSGNQEERRKDLEALEELVPRLGDRAKLAETRLQRATYETAIGHYSEARRAGEGAAALFREVGDVAGEATTRLALSLALYQSAEYAEAREAAQQGLAQARKIDRHDLEGGCLANLGIIADLSGERQESRAYFEQALAVYKRANFPSKEARLLSNLGVAYWRVHDLEEASRYFLEALAKSRQVGARTTEGVALSNLAMVLRSKGDLEEARRHIEQGLVVNREVASPYAIARTLGILASVHTDLGDYPAARAADEEALAIDRKVGDRQDMGYRLTNLGRLARRLGEHDKSATLLAEALTLTREMGDRDSEAAALRGLTALHLDLGEPTRALELANQALGLSKELEDHEGQALAALLAGHARMAIDDIDGAERAYLYARDLKVSSVAPSTAAGLAHVAMRRNDPVGAAALIEPIVGRLLARDTAGMEEIFRLYATTRGVLEETNDDRAPELLRVGRETLAEYAARLPDEAARKSFLEDVTINRILGS